MTLLPLKRLSDESIADLSAAMLGPAGKQTALVDFLVRETEGNAFFIVEVVRALAEEAGQLDRVAQMKLPEHVAAGGMMSVVQRRLSRVRPADRPLLELAAVAGRQLDVALLQNAAHEMDVAAWLMRCANAAVLEPQATVWRFVHDRLREGLLSELSAEQRRALHRRVALALEAAYPQAAEQAAALAHHWGAAGDPAKEARYAMLAGEQALKTSAPREALQYFWRALAVFPEPPEQADETSRLRMTLLYRLGETYFQLGELREAHDNQQASLALAHALNDQKAKASALSLLGALLLAQGKTEQAEASLQDNLTLFRSLDAPAGLAQTLRRLGGWATSCGEYARARQFHEESLIIAREISDQKTIASNLNELGRIASNLKAWEESARCYQDSLMLFKALGDRGSAALVLNNLSLVFSAQGRHAEALQFCQEALAVFEEIGDRMATTLIRDSLGSIAHALGDDAQARQHFKDSLAAAMEIGLTPSAILSLVGLAKVRVSAGDREQALELLGLAFNHPACDAEGRERGEPLLAELRTVLPPDVVEAALERGKTKDLNAVVAEILGEK